MVERSVDSGATWTALPTGDIDLRIVSALTATSETDLELIGAAGPECTVGGFSSSDAGDSWTSSPELLSTAAYEAPVAADGSTAVVLSGQLVAAPCPGVEVMATGSERIVAACSAVLAEWEATTGTWSAIPFAGIHALDVQAEQILFAARGVPGCAGLGVLRVSGATLTSASATESIGCVSDANLASPAALASGDGVSWLWVGDALFTSGDGGATWAALAS
ncbi:hypothetical protein [Plantibacter cousiniae (nom. nud.)]|uniref:hypothetical protein n=1 Tax=Plantibacter cousiniae (nom. nud.) TaxID=199709 RepID=UPI001E38ED1B|nr:hypothetical protein [Plantibacter cousiniae]